MNKRNVFSLGLLGQKASAASFGQCHYIPHCTGSYIARATASRQPSYRWRRTVSDIDGWKLRSRRQVREKAVRCRIHPEESQIHNENRRAEGGTRSIAARPFSPDANGQRPPPSATVCVVSEPTLGVFPSAKLDIGEKLIRIACDSASVMSSARHLLLHRK
jgi:hypothetical protein